jgi:hypothetical protein
MSEGPFRPRGEDREPPEPPEDEQPEKRELLKRPPPAPRARNVGGLGPNTTWIIGVLATLFVVYITYNTINTDSQGSRGITSGAALPPFVAPLALSELRCETEDGEQQECDANVQRVEREGIPRACDAHREGAVNSCDLVKRGPVVVAFLVGPSQRCIDEVDLLNGLAPRFPKVQFVAVAIRGDHEDLNDKIRKHGWDIPVAYDHDGAIANAFAVAVCPTITFAYKGGEVEHTSLGTTPEAEIVQHLRTIQQPPPTPTPTIY